MIDDFQEYPMLEHDQDHPIVVAFAGYIGAGKDTAAGFLSQFLSQFIYDQDNVSNRVELRATSFAQPVKQLLRYVYDLSENDVYGNVDRAARERPHPNLNGKSPRYVMQQIATQGFRHMVDNDTWVAHWYRNEYVPAQEGMAQANSQFADQGGCQPVVLHITDFRFVNEYEYMRANCPNLIVYFIERHPKSWLQKFIDRWDYFNLSRRRSHDSERQIDEILRKYGDEVSIIDNTRTMAVQDWMDDAERAQVQDSGLAYFKDVCHEAFMEDFAWRFVP